MAVMDTRTRGDVAEAAVLQTLVAARFIVSIPFGRFGPYDLAVETPGGFVRVQVKSGRLRGGCVEFNCVGTDHGDGVKSYVDRADVFAVHVHATGEQYLVPVADAMAAKMLLRVKPTLNNQVSRVRFARDYRLADWVVRQIGEPPSRDGRGAVPTTAPEIASEVANTVPR